MATSAQLSANEQSPIDPNEPTLVPINQIVPITPETQVAPEIPQANPQIVTPEDLASKHELEIQQIQEWMRAHATDTAPVIPDGLTATGATNDGTNGEQPANAGAGNTAVGDTGSGNPAIESQSIAGSASASNASASDASAPDQDAQGQTQGQQEQHHGQRDATGKQHPRYKNPWFNKIGKKQA